MLLHRIAGLCLVFMTAVGIASAQTARTVNDPDSYAIYTAVLRDEWPVRDAKAKRLVMMIETEVYPEKIMASCLKPEPAYKAELEPLLLAYREANKRPWTLQRKFDISIPYELVTRDSLKTVLEVPFNPNLDPWEDFYKRYPDSGGVLMMSAVGFNVERKMALVYMGHFCGSLCGGGDYHLLKKKKANG